MTRFIFSTFSFLLLFSTSAQAGFEWVPPMNDPAPLSQEVMPLGGAEFVNEGNSFPVPSVSAQPLANKPIHNPITALPVQTKPKVKNLAGKKLVIDPYPLRDNAAPPSSIKMSEVYKAMNEESGKLHPVRLGNAMTTGAKRISEPVVPQAVRISSAEHKTFLTPTEGRMTPMIGGEPTSLPGSVGTLRPTAARNLPQKYTEAVGFGRDLPLALALSQVIPPEFTHSFAKDVDAGAAVSWEGGKPWDQVLNDMLRSKNMTAVIQGNQVIIQPLTQL